MKIGYYQYSPIFHNLEETRNKISAAVSGNCTDLLVLPELALSGYLFSSQDELALCAETLPGPTSDFFSSMAVKNHTSYVYGCVEDALDGSFFNSSVYISPEGVMKVYRKAHLFNREKLHFKPGNEDFFTFDVNGTTVGMLICFDHLFPEAARTLALLGAQIICHPSNLVIEGAAQITTRSRSIENRVFWILANRIGSEQSGPVSCTYTGGSQITGPDGSILASSSPDKEEIAIIDIDPDLARDKNITRRNHIFSDRREDLYHL
ncbi:MAG: hypothetical protein K9L21_00200 [Spirochaetia bacterium]|nr:hypothetical protein [Spirochaetia bacterium]